MSVVTSQIAPLMLLIVLGVMPGPLHISAQEPSHVLTGRGAFTDFRSQQPGVFHRITVQDLPKPFETKSANNSPTLVQRPSGAWPKAPVGFKVDLYATGFNSPRLIRVAPNGDIFLAESFAGQIKILRGVTASGKAAQISIFAEGLDRPFGIAFYPPGDNPQWVYVANTNSVVRYPYQSGDLSARASAITIVNRLAGSGGHWTRDVAFSLDGKRMFVSVGSRSNVGDPRTRAEANRADILEYTPAGTFVKVYASGIRNPAGVSIDPLTGQLWCSTNERDGLGDYLVPDFITQVQEDGFYGWPWFYIGAHEDPRREGEHQELKNRAIIPDVLLQPHFASLGMTFYNAKQFPSEYSGDIFAAEHGSWNRSSRAGYEVIRVPLKNGKAEGTYEDFLTGFVTQDGLVWGRPVGVAVAKDGSLLMSDDGSKSIWKVTYTGK
jgi:glucose/arabinose dehydrogenase